MDPIFTRHEMRVAINRTDAKMRLRHFLRGRIRKVQPPTNGKSLHVAGGNSVSLFTHSTAISPEVC